MRWDTVLENEARQRLKYQKISETVDQPSMADFYPELHDSLGWNGAFANTVGSDLIPQLLTTPHVFVDLYNWENPAGLIKYYGVDLNFLLELRDVGLVKLSANLPVEKYKKCSWLYGVLGDEKTIFRSTRTPLFFQAIDRSIIDEQARLRTKLTKRFDQSSEQLESLIELSAAAFRPTNADDFANALAWWCLRLKALRPVDGSEICETIDKDPQGVIPILRQKHFLAVSPLSAGLGGMYPIRFDRLKPFLDQNASLWKITETDQVKLKSINEILSRLRLEAATDDLASEEFWNRINQSRYKKDELLKKLEDNEERKRAFNAERVLREQIAGFGDSIAYKELDDYVQRELNRWDQLGDYSQLGMFASVGVFGIIAALGDMGLASAIVGAGVGLAGCTIFHRVGQKFLEKSISTLQVVNFVRPYKRK